MSEVMKETIIDGERGSLLAHGLETIYSQPEDREAWHRQFQANFADKLAGQDRGVQSGRLAQGVDSNQSTIAPDLREEPEVRQPACDAPNARKHEYASQNANKKRQP